MTATYLYRSLLAIFVLIAFALAEIVVIAVVLPRDASAHEAPPSEIVITGIEDAPTHLAVTLDLLAASERLDLPSLSDGKFNEADLQRISEQISKTLAMTVNGRAMELRSEEAFLRGAQTAAVSLSADMSTSSGVLSITPGDALGDSLVRFVDQPVRYVAAAESAEFVIEPQVTSAKSGSTLVQYVKAGFVHIVPMGLDHILFVVGLFLLTLKVRPLLLQVSLFTLAHSVTLALGAIGLLRVPGVIVEPLIAASIVFVAVENIVSRDFSRWRPYVVFGFGLLHGLGFASVLAEFGLPDAQFLAALVGFNIGVELGQLFVLAVCFLALGYWFSGKTWYRGWVAVPASVAVGAVGLIWTAERVGLAL